MTGHRVWFQTNAINLNLGSIYHVLVHFEQNWTDVSIFVAHLPKKQLSRIQAWDSHAFA
jgi:regulator of sirC expression with transglutaminase-like and TPR domain